MSRLKNYSRNLVTTSLQLGISSVYSLVSIPIILHWLPKAEFGLWAVLVQLMGYLALVDLGMTGAVSRLLVDHKDDRANGNYGSLLQTAALVSAAQGALVLAIVAVGAPWLALLMKIPPAQQHTFVLLMQIQGVITAFNFCCRPLNLMLFAHQRMDLQAYTDISNMVLSFGVLIFFLTKGLGIYAYVCANAAAALWAPGVLFWHCRRLGLLPRAGEWGRATGKMFREVFGFGHQIFLLNLANQLLSASQTIVVSRALGLDAAAVWSVGTKMFNLVVPLMNRPYWAALPGLSEMVARGELERLKLRFQNLVLLIASFGAFLAGSFLLCNSLFVTCWTSGKITWPPEYDVLMALWLFLQSLQTTHVTFTNINKQLGAMSYVALAEGTVFVVSALAVGSWLGMAGIIGCSIVCMVAFTWQYSVRRSCRYFHCGFREIAFGWVRPAFRLALAYALVIAIVWFGAGGLPPFARLALHATVAVVAGGLLFVRLGFPMKMRQEAASRLPRPVARLFRIFVGLPQPAGTIP